MPRLLDTPCTAGARSAGWVWNTAKIEISLVVDALEICSKQSSNLTFILIMTPRTSIRWFSKTKKVAKKWSKKGPLNLSVSMANVLVGGSTFEIRKIDVSNRHLLRAAYPPPFPLPKNQLLSGRTKNERTDFGQSNSALSNVRALRAIITVSKISI